MSLIDSFIGNQHFLVVLKIVSESLILCSFIMMCLTVYFHLSCLILMCYRTENSSIQLWMFFQLLYQQTLLLCDALHHFCHSYRIFVETYQSIAHMSSLFYFLKIILFATFRISQYSILQFDMFSLTVCNPKFMFFWISYLNDYFSCPGFLIGSFIFMWPHFSFLYACLFHNFLFSIKVVHLPLSAS